MIYMTTLLSPWTRVPMTEAASLTELRSRPSTAGIGGTAAPGLHQ